MEKIQLLKIIKKAAQKGQTTLDLPFEGIKELPPDIGKLTWLTTLKLSYNQLRSLPPEIGQLKNLTQLELLGNQLRSLPPEIGQLKNLTVLDLHTNQLTSLPPELGQLKNLTMLDLHTNQLTSLPPELGQLKNLTQLNLGGNRLCSLPPELGKLTGLTTLYLNINQLSSLPPEIENLTNLKVLYLNINQLSSLPAELGNLTNLEVLYLYNNQLSSLPHELGQLKNLQELVLEGNPLESPPPEVVKQGTQAVLAYLRGVFGDFEKPKKVAEKNIFSRAVKIVVGSPVEDDSEDLIPLWLKFDRTPNATDVATAILTLDNLAALIRVFHKEMKETRVYVGVMAEASPWHEKERQEEEARLVRVFEDPVSAINPSERLAIYRAFEGSLYLGLGKLPKWLWSKLKKLWDIIPDWKRAKGEFDRMTAEAEKVRAEAQKIEQETKTIGPKSEVEIAQEWEKLRKMEQDRLLKGLEHRIKMIESVLKMAPPECKTLSPKAAMALLNKLMSTLDDVSTTDQLGSFLIEDEMKKLPPIQTQEIETDGPEKV